MLELPKQAFNFNELWQIIIDAPKQDVTEELKTDDFNVSYRGKIHPQYMKTLRQALEEFRQYFKPRVIKHGEMHFNYANLQTAFDLYDEQYHKLKVASNGNWDKRDLYWQQVIVFIQRGLPACDQGFVRRLYRLTEEIKALKLLFVPVIAREHSVSAYAREAPWGQFTKFMTSKSIKLVELIQLHQQKKVRCVVF